MNVLVPEITSVMKATPDRLTYLAGTLPSELMVRKPAQDQWSATECIRHLIDAEQVFQYRIKCFLEGRDFPNFDPKKEGSKERADRSAVELAREFAGLREATFAALQGLREEDLDRRAQHSELGAVTLREMLYEWAGHDLLHLSQADRAVMQPFIHNCGPWKRYYSKYVL